MSTKVFGTEFFVSIGVDVGAAKPVSSITAANPPLVSAAAHGLESGDVIELKGTGSPDTDTVYIVEKVDEGSFRLATDDWRNLTAITAVGVTFVKHKTTQYCDLTNLDLKPREVSYETERTICRVTKTSTIEPGTISGKAYWSSENDLHRVLNQLNKTQEKIITGLREPNSNILYGYRAYVATISRGGDADGKYEADVEFQLDSEEAEIELVP